MVLLVAALRWCVGAIRLPSQGELRLAQRLQCSTSVGQSGRLGPRVRTVNYSPVHESIGSAFNDDKNMQRAVQPKADKKRQDCDCRISISSQRGTPHMCTYTANVKYLL
eukprot:GHVT01002922.1.p1 GENE.GHVT01002922.1~~GHVT01002922.1.p1  ORF type:complete len:109 (-),score=4.68 GHVT01002922.1:35-361(-)